MAHRPDTPKPLGLAAALVPVVALVVLLGLSFFLFGDAAASGPNQVALVFCSILAIAVAWRHGHSIDDLRDAAVASVTAGLPAVFILLSVGALIGTWAMSGTLIAMVYYGLKLLSPDYFYPTACLICLAVAVSIGSSWTVAGTLGIGLMGIARQDGPRPGDHGRRGDLRRLFRRQAVAALRHRQPRLRRRRRRSLRPRPGVAPDLGPCRSRLRSCCFWLLGSAVRVRRLRRRRRASRPPSSPRWCISSRWRSCSRWRCCAGRRSSPSSSARSPAASSPSPTLPSGSLPSPMPGSPAGLALLKGVWAALASGYVSATGEPAVDQLLSRGGMASMLGTVWLILVALAFGGIHREGRRARAPDRAGDRRGALGRRPGRGAGRRGLRHQRARLRPVYRRRAAGADVPRRLRSARPRSGRAVADARRFRAR